MNDLLGRDDADVDPKTGSLLEQEEEHEASILLDARFSDAAPPRAVG
ncbi:hypothetical protein [Actinoplanes sp. NPDC089786]